MSAIFSIMTVALPELRFHETLYHRRLGDGREQTITWAGDDGEFVPQVGTHIESVPSYTVTKILQGSGRGVFWASCRYVDNRVTASARAPGLPALPSALTDPEFYGAPVRMVTEPALDYMELTLSVRDGQIHGEFKVPSASEKWRYRSVASAGSEKVLTGVCIGRLVAAASMAFPMDNKRRAVAQLFKVYLSLALPSGVLDRLIRSQARRFPGVYRPMLKLIRAAINGQDSRILNLWAGEPPPAS